MILTYKSMDSQTNEICDMQKKKKKIKENIDMASNKK